MSNAPMSKTNTSKATPGTTTVAGGRARAAGHGPQASEAATPTRRERRQDGAPSRRARQRLAVQQHVQRQRVLRRAAAGLVVLIAVVALALALRPGATPAAAQAPDFSLPVASGATGGVGQISARALRGHPAVLTFFTPACTGCVQQLPALRQALQDYHSRGLTVVGVDMGGDPLDVAHAFAQAHNIPFPIAIDPGQATAQRFQVPADPTTFFLDAQGRIRGQYPGPVTTQALQSGLAAAGVPAPGAS